MKCLLLLPLALLAAPLAAADPALPKFDSSVIGVPPLSLAELDQRLTGTKPPTLSLAPRPTPALATVAAASRPAVMISRMPILRPDPAVDYPMTVKVPDPAIDPKMIIRDPGIASVK